MNRDAGHAQVPDAAQQGRVRTSAVTAMAVRPYTGLDADQVLALVNADRVPGQPEVTGAMLTEAIAGRSPIDAGWWDELVELHTDVLDRGDGTVSGVVAYAHRPRDGAGVILWLHGREEPRIVGELVAHAVESLADCRVVEAFSFSSALGLGLEALPVRQRPVTDQALRNAGFDGLDLWRYMHRRLPAPDLPCAAAVEVTSPDPRTRQLTVRHGGQVAAEATIGVPVAGIGMLGWIGVEPAHRGSGLGMRVLGTALDLLAGLGAGEVILYVDDEDPDPRSDRSRHAANQLYDRAGFTEVSRLHSYRLRR